ncbi:hypothetical protein QBC38DRAFT_460545 [Podospora fimiseda]|uniref:Uncharacterized protein n=1 Tax=Podospora fimiseda TaxID=252190 RepID=A0AAN6YQM5_9PEZI|nr:hypothetical protein QBC38DRAFT_460545 [Podospora fimiseda]
MPTINLGYTAPINPPSAKPVLTLPQIWAGLQRKVRHAEEFVPLIKSCAVESEVVQDEANGGNTVITRVIDFGNEKLGSQKKDGKLVREVCTLYPPVRVDFLQEDGTKIGNYVSEGQDGGLWMTYIFEWRVEEGQEGIEARFKETAKMAVEKTIETIRRLVKEGEL